MRTILFINGGKVTGETISSRFQMRLAWAVDYYRKHANDEDVVFMVSGRWDNATENYLKTESELGKEYIQQELAEAKVYKEDVSVELVGNYAFSKPLLLLLKPDKVIIVTAEFLRERTEMICRKLFSDEINYEFQFLSGDFTSNPTIIEKEANARQLFTKLFGAVSDGDDSAVREILLYKTPYYYKGLINDRDYFDMYWPGGYDHFLQGVAFRNAQSAKS